MNFEERITTQLKELYGRYGYKEYRLPGFDEYSLYAENRSFLGGKDVISFSSGGKLLALRPDVTLSIVKNGRFCGETQKLFYNEKVYRKTAHGGFSEVSQIGVEVIGGVDIAAEAELVTLMLKTLERAGGDYVLELSHVGIVSKVLRSLDLDASDGEYVLRCLEGKNVHDFRKFAYGRGLPENGVRALETLMTIPPKAAKKELDKITVADVTKEIDEIDSIIGFAGGEKINVDFSVGGDTEYYNGLIFKGYVKGIPHAVLSGGRYDKLLSKFDRNGTAMGFALYLGEMINYSEKESDEPEAVMIYTDENALYALKKAEEMRSRGIKLLTAKNVPEGFKGKIYYAEKDND